MATEQEPTEVFKAKSGDFSRWIAGGGSVSPSVISAPCPKCGGRVVCAYAEMGAGDFYDTYAHVCLNPERLRRNAGVLLPQQLGTGRSSA